MSDGRYYVKDFATGRTFCVEPISERNEKIDGHVFTNGGASGEAIKNKQSGGSIREEDSIITPENGYKAITTLPPGTSPNAYISWLCAQNKTVGEGL